MVTTDILSAQIQSLIKQCNSNTADIDDLKVINGLQREKNKILEQEYNMLKKEHEKLQGKIVKVSYLIFYCLSICNLVVLTYDIVKTNRCLPAPSNYLE